MFLHYLKIAFRNLWKYKTRNFISIMGLAVGFVCFSLSAIWIRYETSYDSFHPKAGRIYLVQTYPRKWDTQNPDSTEKSSSTAYSLSRYLKSTFPEIEDICSVNSDIKNSGVIIYVDSAFFSIFDLPKPPEGFFERGSIKPAIITNDYHATEYLKNELELEIQGVIPRWPENTNIPFQVIAPLWVRYSDESLSVSSRASGGFQSWVLLKKGVDLAGLHKKTDKIIYGESPLPASVFFTPIEKYHYSDPAIKRKTDIKFNHIFIFSLSGLLVILCALFNHITLYVSQMQMRMREFALRKVNGSSNGQIIKLLYTEFLLVLFISLVAGLMFLSSAIPYFKEYASIGSSNTHIFTELSVYAVGIIVFAFIMGLLPILHFRKRTLQETIQHQHTARNKNMFRKISLTLQLTISIGLLFCSMIIFKQMYFLINTDLGIKRHNIASVYAGCCSLNAQQYMDKLKQIPGITDVLQIKGSFLNYMITYSSSITTTTDDGIESKVLLSIFFNKVQIDNHFFDFFNIDIVEGEIFPNEFYGMEHIISSDGTVKTVGQENHNPNKRIVNNVVVNETFAKGLEGNLIGQEVSDMKIVGIAKDFFISPTAKVQPLVIHYSNALNALAYKYEEGQRRQTQQAVTQWLRKEFPDQGEFEIKFTYMEDVFEKYFESERALLTLLSFMTGVCILIAIFGVYSLTNLTCEQRRKEIAIRKINGAEVLDIMNIFFKEYLLLLALAALAAFPAGYIIMKHWMEEYVKQTSMDAWVFLLIFLVVFVIIVFTIVSMVWKTANRNPAEVVKME